MEVKPLESSAATVHYWRQLATSFSIFDNQAAVPIDFFHHSPLSTKMNYRVQFHFDPAFPVISTCPRQSPSDRLDASLP